jgi:hypothetical protein
MLLANLLGVATGEKKICHTLIKNNNINDTYFLCFFDASHLGHLFIDTHIHSTHAHYSRHLCTNKLKITLRSEDRVCLEITEIH